MEFRKGVLFVRLFGELTKDTIDVLQKEVTNIVKLYEIGDVVFNLSGLDRIDQYGISALKKNYQVSSLLHGKLVVCGLEDETEIRNKMKENRIFDFLFETSDELSALHYLER